MKITTVVTKYLYKNLIPNKESLCDSNGVSVLAKISAKISFRYFRVRHNVDDQLYGIFDNLLAMDDNTNDT